MANVSGGRKYLKRDVFAEELATGQSLDGILRKQYTCDSIKTPIEKVTTETQQRRFVVSTAAVDRDNDVISPKGWHLDNYRKNPVVLFAHDYSSLPIGKCVDIRMEHGGQLVATTEFADHEMAGTVLRLIDKGFLNATSVGFRPMKCRINKERQGLDFEEQELLEFSIVPVPANPEALIIQRELNGDVALIKQWATSMIKALNTADVEDEKPDEKPDGKPPEEPRGGSPKGITAASVAMLVVRALKGGCECMADPDHDNETCKCCKGGSCDCTKCAGQEKATTSVTKRGRVLSQKNEAKVRAAHGHLTEVLDTLLPDEDVSGEGDQKPVEKSGGDDFDITLADGGGLLDIEVEAMREAFSDVLKSTVIESVREMVKAETVSAVNRVRGRLD